MTELIKALVGIKDPFTLFAFIAVILLVAFRTNTVPEMVFKLIGEKITRDRFYALLHRSLLYAFAAFLVLCGIAALGQVLSYMTTSRTANLEELKAEITLRQVDETAARRAVDEYEKGLRLAQSEKLSEAIASLEASLKAVSTATARETLALLYEKAGDPNRAVQVAAQAVSAARETGSALNTARAERLLQKVTADRPELSGRLPASSPTGQKAQGSLSTDRDNPVQLTSNEVRGTGIDRGRLRYYWRLRGGPGELKVTFDFTSGGLSQFATLNLFDEDFKPIQKVSIVGNRGDSARQVRRIQLVKQQNVIVELDFESNYGGSAGTFLFRADGAVQF